MNTTGEKIKKCRERCGLTQAALAEQAGLSKRTVTKYEMDSVTPRGQNLYRLAEVLGVSAEYLSNSEIDDPTYGLDEEPYIAEARNRYGKRGAQDMQGLLTGVQALFAGGDVPQQDKDLFFQAVMEAYLETKQEAHDKFTPNKFKQS